MGQFDKSSDPRNNAIMSTPPREQDFMPPFGVLYHPLESPEGFLYHPEVFWRLFEELGGSLWEDFKRTSINMRTTKKMRFWGQYNLQTASGVKYKIRFEIYGPNYICYHVYFGYFDLFLHFDKRWKNTTYSTRPVNFTAGKNCHLSLLLFKILLAPIILCASTSHSI